MINPVSTWENTLNIVTKLQELRAEEAALEDDLERITKEIEDADIRRVKLETLLNTRQKRFQEIRKERDEIFSVVSHHAQTEAESFKEITRDDILTGVQVNRTGVTSIRPDLQRKLEAIVQADKEYITNEQIVALASDTPWEELLSFARDQFDRTESVTLGKFIERYEVHKETSEYPDVS